MRWRTASGVVLLTAAGGCTLLAPLDGLSSGGDAGSDGATGADVVAGDGPAPGDAGSEVATHDAPASGDSSSGSDGTGGGPDGLRRTITVTAKDAVAAGYVVRFSLDTHSLVAAGKALASLADLRVLDPLGAERDRVLDAPDSTATTVWFALSQGLAAGASATYWLAYDHPDAGPAAASGANVFAFYDDFPGTTVASHWIEEGNPTVSGGVLTLHAWQPDAGPAPDSLTTNYQTDGVPAASAVEIVATVPNPASPADPSTGFWYWLGYQHQGDFEADAPWILWIARDVSTVQAEEALLDASFISPTPLTQDGGSHSYVVARAPSQTTFLLDGTTHTTVPFANGTDYSLMLRNFCPQTAVLVSLVRVRPLVDQEPTIALGAEQPGP